MSIKQFDKVQDLQWESTNWDGRHDRSPWDDFKDLIKVKAWSARELCMIGEALLVYQNYDKERVQKYVDNLEELGVGE